MGDAMNMLKEDSEKNRTINESLSTKTIDELNHKATLLINVDNQKSLYYSSQAHHLSTTGKFSSDPYQEGLTTSLNVLCEVNMVLGNSQITMELGEKVMALFKAQNNLDGQAKVLSVVGFNHFICGNYPEAIENLLLSLQLAGETSNLPQQGRSLSFLAAVYSCTGEEKKSAETFDKSIEISSSAKDEITLAITYNNMAVYYSEIEKNDIALVFSQKSLELCDKLGLSDLTITGLDTIGNIYFQMKNYVQAEKHFCDVINICKSSDKQQYTYVVSLLNLGRLQLDLGNEEMAVSYIVQSLEMAEKIDSKREQFLTHQLLSKIYAQKGEFQKAFLHHKKFQIIEKTVYNQKANGKIKALELLHKTESEKKEAEIYQLKNVELKNKIKEMSLLNNALQKAFDEIKPLKGIIPTCSNCKKIRDDTGYWNRIESYIQKHSEAEFSHGVCPECLEELYGKDDWYIEMKEEEKKLK